MKIIQVLHGELLIPQEVPEYIFKQIGLGKFILEKFEIIKQIQEILVILDVLIQKYIMIEQLLPNNNDYDIKLLERFKLQIEVKLKEIKVKVPVLKKNFSNYFPEAQGNDFQFIYEFMEQCEEVNFDNLKLLNIDIGIYTEKIKLLINMD